MREGIERLRKTLSSNSEAILSVDCVTSDEDLHMQFTRADFEATIKQSGFLRNFEEILNKFVSFCIQNDLVIDEVEILGGGTRIPIISSTIKAITGKEKLGIVF